MSAYSRRGVIGAMAAAGGATALALAGCGQGGSQAGSGGTAGQRQPVHIGAAVSTTGSNGRTGLYQVEAYKLWEEQVNQRGGLLGRPVTMTILDDASDPTTGQKLYEKLITEDKVDLVLGPYASSVTQAASTVTEKYKYPMLSAGASASDIWKRNYRYIFGVYSVAESYFHGVIDLALKQGYKTIAVVHEDTIFPAATASGTVAYAKSKGMDVLPQERYPQRVTDVSSLLTKIKGQNPDVLVGGSYLPDSVLITRQAKELDLNPKLLAFSVGAAMPEFIEALGADADFIFGPSMWEPALKTPGNQEFVESYQKKWNREPDYHAATGFAGGQILEAAAKKANSLDREKLRDALASLETTTILPGRYKVDEAGAQVGHIAVVVQWQGREKPIVWPDQFKSGSHKLPTPAWKER
ncbi:MAG TPA: amino acid ABC transporter substrate-binding protein [Chloroflexota bacterium]|nr:amino acid ABC transporter substrate-binding protein [Chloroflexota bacterium]